MAIEIVMPRLGWTMEEGVLVEWMKHDGDTIHPGDIMFTIETDKALNEVESFEEGIFRIPPDSDVLGKTLPVGTLLAYIVKPGEAAPFEGPHPPTPFPLTERGSAPEPPSQPSPCKQGRESYSGAAYCAIYKWEVCAAEYQPACAASGARVGCGLGDHDR